MVKSEGEAILPKRKSYSYKVSQTISLKFLHLLKKINKTKENKTPTYCSQNKTIYLTKNHSCFKILVNKAVLVYNV